MMWIKICGITNKDDAITAMRSGVDAIGLNFFRGSKRYVTPAVAAEIVQAVRSEASGASPDFVGVFVNSAADEIVQIVRDVQLDVVQFHGEESEQLIQSVHQQIPDVALIRAKRISAERLEESLQELETLAKRIPLSACLLDAYVAGEYGGTGHQLGANLAAALRNRVPSRFILAGGLKADNVARAIRTFEPWGVDTASGVEISPGCKDADLMQAFIREARGDSSGNVRL